MWWFWIVQLVSTWPLMGRNPIHRACGLVKCRLTVFLYSLSPCHQTSCQTWANSHAKSLFVQDELSSVSWRGTHDKKQVNVWCVDKQSEIPKNILNLTRTNFQKLRAYQASCEHQLVLESSDWYTWNIESVTPTDFEYITQLKVSEL